MFRRRRRGTAVGDAVDDVLGGPEEQDAARRMAAAIREELASVDAVQELERVLSERAPTGDLT